MPYDFVSVPTSKLFVIPSNTNYVVETFKIPPLLDSSTPALKVLAELLTWKYLLPLIREQGGAYGAGCSVSNSGTASFYSFRDPQSLSTFNNYEQAIQNICNARFTQQDLDSAKLTLFSKLDKEQLKKSKLLSWFLRDYSEDTSERFREDCLAVTGEQVKQVCEEFFLESLAKDESSRVVFGSPSNNLEGFLAKGWLIENFVDDLSLDPQDYS